MRTLRYQLELLSSRGDLPAQKALGEAHDTFKSMVKELGQITDLIAMGELIDEARASVVGIDLKPLSRALGDLIAARLERVFGEGGLVFAVKPRDFLALEVGGAPEDVKAPANVETPAADTAETPAADAAETPAADTTDAG